MHNLVIALFLTLFTCLSFLFVCNFLKAQKASTVLKSSKFMCSNKNNSLIYYTNQEGTSFNNSNTGLTDEAHIAENINIPDNKKQCNKKKIITIIIISILIPLIVLISVLVPVCNKENPKNYYFTEEFMSLTTKEKVLMILRKEGEGNYSENKNSYALEKSGEGDYHIQLSYYEPSDELSLGLSITIDYMQLIVVIFLEPGKTTHDLWMRVHSGNEIISVGKVNLYAPTYYNDVVLKFEQYSGDLLKSEAQWLVAISAHRLLLDMNTMLKEYNFSLNEFGFYRYAK